jgi:iron complex outermembrane receptor protein
MKVLLQKLQFGSSVIALAAASAFASMPAQAQDAGGVEAVTVTGTSIRGSAPVGSNLITVSPEDIQKTGGQTVQQVLANVPAITGMGNAGEGGAIHNNYYQPSIHQLGASASNATLILIDGHRPPTGGTNHSTADPNILPANMLERVEVIANGTSSIYGSDAVAGVINFITRKKFDGVQLTGEAAFVDGATNENLGVLAGSSWASGSFVFGYQFYNQGQLLSKNRPYTYPDQTARAAASGIPITAASSQTNFNNFNCQTALVRVNGAGNYYDVATGSQYSTAQSAAPCNTWDSATLLPSEQRNNAMIKLTQDFGDKLTMGADMVYAVRRDRNIGSRATPTGPTAGNLASVTVYGPGSGKGTQINPFFQAPAGYTGPAATSETVFYNPDNLLGGPTGVNANGSISWYGDVTAEYHLPGDFVLNGIAVAGRDESYSIQNNGTLNPSSAYLALNGTTNTAGSLTQISIPGTSVAVTQPLTTDNALDIWGQGANNRTSSAVIGALSDNRSLTRNIASYQQARASLDGSLFSLPAGDAKVAVGGEVVSYQLTQEGVQSNNTGPATLGSTHLLFQFNRTVYSGYTELNVPLISADMNIPLVESLSANLSGRYDSYTDAGDTKNYKLAFSWGVGGGLKLRGNMSTSFVAPGIDVVGDVNSAYLPAAYTGTTVTTPIPVSAYPAITQFPASFFNNGQACTSASVTCTFASTVQGSTFTVGDHAAKPQRGHGWELGFDYSPDFVPGLTSSFTYWHTVFLGGITAPTIGNVVNNAGLNNLLTLYPNGVSAAFVNSLATGIRQSGSIPATNYFVWYSRAGNYLDLFIEGIDSSIRYDFDTDWGAMHAGAVASIFTRYDQAYGEGGGVFNILNTTGANTSFPSIQLQSRYNVGWSDGPYGLDLFLNWTGGYRNWSGTSLTPLTRNAQGNPSGGGDPVKANVTVDLNATYDFTTGWFGDDQLTLNVRNLLDKEPPFYLGATGYDNWAGSPLGRVITVGLRAKL